MEKRHDQHRTVCGLQIVGSADVVQNLGKFGLLMSGGLLTNRDD